VAYNAFDPDLQLWVAACIYKGIEDFLVLHLGGHDPVLDTTLYPYCSRLATTLQVPEEMWPPTRAAFQAYWEAGLERVEMDGLTRAYLRGIADQSVLWAPLGRVGKPIAALLRPVTTFINLGWLPEPFRTELGLTWSARRQARFDRILAAAIAVNRRLPRPVREFPLNLYLRDARRRLGSNRPFV
jgi:uncharacterized protein (DUF2236 family)